MNVHIQVNLLIAAALYLLWALAMFMGQQETHPLLSTGPYDAAASSMFGASLFAFVVLFLIALLNPIKELVYASAAALAFLALVALYQLFISHNMPQNPATFFSLLISGTIAAILFFSMIQAPTTAGVGHHAGSSRTRTGRRTRSASSRRVARGAAAGRSRATSRSRPRKVKKKVGARRERR